jgi:hypothetical protein
MNYSQADAINGPVRLRLPIAFAAALCHNRALPAARPIKGCRGGGEVLISTRSLAIAGIRAGARMLIL